MGWHWFWYSWCIALVLINGAIILDIIRITRSKGKK